MKKLVLAAMSLLFAITAEAQREVTRFLGIPVDGSKYEMIQKLKEKGFRSTSYDRDILEGEFNGRDVQILVVTNNNKVYRIYVRDARTVGETDIRIRFNTLCRQFKNNPKYSSVSADAIPADEDISYEMSVNKKRYDAYFVQKSAKGQQVNQTEEQTKISSEVEELQRLVWFKISEFCGEYCISMFYDNEYNHANGEDL